MKFKSMCMNNLEEICLALFMLTLLTSLNTNITTNLLKRLCTLNLKIKNKNTISCKIIQQRQGLSSTK